MVWLLAYWPIYLADSLPAYNSFSQKENQEEKDFLNHNAPYPAVPLYSNSGRYFIEIFELHEQRKLRENTFSRIVCCPAVWLCINNIGLN